MNILLVVFYATENVAILTMFSFILFVFMKFVHSNNSWNPCKFIRETCESNGFGTRHYLRRSSIFSECREILSMLLGTPVTIRRWPIGGRYAASTANVGESIGGAESALSLYQNIDALAVEALGGIGQGHWKESYVQQQEWLSFQFFISRNGRITKSMIKKYRNDILMDRHHMDPWLPSFPK